MTNKTVTAFAPATVANVAVGFDILGFSFDAVGDKVSVTKISQPIVEIESISGAKLSLDPMENCASIGLLHLIKDLKLKFGFSLKINKGIPLGSGMGGSAASSVAALVAANEFLPQALSREELFPYALMGEHLASGASHPDNITPCLFGELTLIRSVQPLQYIKIPVPKNIYCVVVHPHMQLETRASRAALKSDIALKDHVKQSANLATFIAACYTDKSELLKGALADVVVEPQRASLIPGFLVAKKAALLAGALGVSISGSGPSVFAWCDSEKKATEVAHVLIKAFSSVKLKADSWISKISHSGARILKE